MAEMYRAVLIDRDGTINRDVPYCSRPEDFELLPMAAEGILLLKEYGFKVVVVTNQSGIARGYFSVEMLNRIHSKMCVELAAKGAAVDAIYYCPHHPDDHCRCRKPQPTMAFQAARELNLELSSSYVIGDSDTDIQMGKAAGCRSVLVSYGSKMNAVQPDYVALTVYDAARWILEQIKLEADNKKGTLVKDRQ